MAQYAVLDDNNKVTNIVEADADNADASWILLDYSEQEAIRDAATTLEEAANAHFEVATIGSTYNHDDQTWSAPVATADENKLQAQISLVSTDWTQLPDCGLTDACVALFATYRASLRIIRQSDVDENVTWPEKPAEEWA